ncbi:hypothetical protein K7W42_04125 [Deinococcus sp. HMF7604]|uniref:hypothetical protein n=1 Tax=Deinococcus betulae TaxID=2873312 RepID=UPI001CCAB430|nr:hypothetical protein [Deinococcus betulae]MBZ9750045.1 hypothetical protein [Deinococcus betulae]
MRSLLLLPALFLAACAPAATTADVLKGPLVEGERWTITGRDQFNEKVEGEVVVPAAPDYDRTEREWSYEDARAYIGYTESNRHFQVWDTRDAKRLVVCIVRQPYIGGVREYPGISVTGSMADLDAVFAKLSGTGTKLTGGDCTVKRGG